jgi:hypothetical protein
VARRKSLMERRGWPAIPNGRAGQTDTRMGAQWRVDGRSTEGDKCPTEGARVPDGESEWPDKGRDGCPTEGGVSGGGPTAGLGDGPTGDYISAAGPHFWALSSCAQPHVQEMLSCSLPLGNAIMFVANLPMETNANGKLAKELVEKWSRGIFGISDKFEDLKVPHEEWPKPTPPEKEEGIYDRLNGKLKKLKKKNKFLSIQECHHQMKREKLRKGTC